MKTEQLNADFTKRAVMHTARMDWQASPSPSVWRKRLDLSGPAEAGRVTSVVRYDADSAFPPHDHPDGEEIFVLDGVFSDEHGNYPSGTFLLNPEGFRHQPYSKEGCIIFVKLRQYPGSNRRHVVVDTKNTAWTAGEDGRQTLPLYGEPGYPERIGLQRLPRKATATLSAICGAEIFLIAGALEDGTDAYAAGDWVRYPAAPEIRLRATDDSVFYVKSGHLPT